MAWLLHEPRLRAEVPVFCVMAIRPLLRNKGAPLSVSIGAVQLLSHLHTRLEVGRSIEEDALKRMIYCLIMSIISQVLVKEDGHELHGSNDYQGYDHGDTPVLWEVL
jgi:hypothetical protein